MIKIRGEAEGQGAGDVHLLTKEEVVVHEAVRQQNEDRIELHPHNRMRQQGAYAGLFSDHLKIWSWR
jgi:hypothetical protein